MSDVDLVIRNPPPLPRRSALSDRDLNRFVPSCPAGGSEQRSWRSAGPQLLPATARAASEPAGCHSICTEHRGDGNSRCSNGRRPADLALAAGIQGCRLRSTAQRHELPAWIPVERGPCGLVIEVGMCPRGWITATICADPAGRRSGPAGPGDAQAERLSSPGDRSPSPPRQPGSPRQPMAKPGACCNPSAAPGTGSPLQPRRPPSFLTPAQNGSAWRPRRFTSGRWFIKRAA